jgi:hypothetical protein
MNCKFVRTAVVILNLFHTERQNVNTLCSSVTTIYIRQMKKLIELSLKRTIYAYFNATLYSNLFT